jgi:hypothetical protein
MSSPSSVVRQRPKTPNTGQLQQKKTGKDSSTITAPAVRYGELDSLIQANKATHGSVRQWDYKLALAVITLLAFITRFWGIGHPDQVVFDEVHFGKVGLILPHGCSGNRPNNTFFLYRKDSTNS